MRIVNAACTFVAAFAILSASGTAASAAEPPEPPIKNPASIIDSVSPEILTEIMTELSATNIETRQDASGNKVVGFQSDNIPFNMGLALCNMRPGKCIAMTTFVVVDPGATSYPLESFNTFNRDALFVTLVKLDGNKFAVARIWLIDGGVTKKNLAINIASFVLTFQEAMKFLAGQLVAGYQQNGSFLQASAGVGMPRAVPATPDDVKRLTYAMSMKYRTTLQSGK